MVIRYKHGIEVAQLMNVGPYKVWFGSLAIITTNDLDRAKMVANTLEYEVDMAVDKVVYGSNCFHAGLELP